MHRKGSHPAFSRRGFLRAAGGAAIALPLFSSLHAGAQEAIFPKRLVLMYTPNGVIPDAWWPTNVSSETAFDFGQIHQPLLPYRERVMFLGGIDLAIESTGPGGMHQKGIGGLFTGRTLQSGSFVDGCGQLAGWADGISVDQVVAQQIGATSHVASLQLGVRAGENDVQGRVAYAGPGRALPPMNNPSDVFSSLFNGFGQSTDQLAELSARRRSVLDTVGSQFKALSARLGADDQQKLDAHLTLVRDIEQRLTGSGSATGNGSISCSAPALPPALDPASEDDMPAIAKLHFDLLAMAFACDLTRVGSYQISTSLNHIRYPWLGSLGDGHALSHAGPSDANAKQELILRQTWHSQMLAGFLDSLSKIPEGSGTALDNTLIVWGNEISEGNTHSHENIPFVIAGGSWYFRSGRYVQFTHASHNDLLVSIQNAMGVPGTSFGDPSFSKGPLPGLV